MKEETKKYIQQIVGTEIARLQKQTLHLADELKQLEIAAVYGKGNMQPDRPANLSRMSREEYDDLADARVETASLADVVRAALSDEVVDNADAWSRYVKREGATVQ